MRILPVVDPTPEQLPILLINRPVLVIKGAAGSGKTTTALMRLKQLCSNWSARHKRLGLQRPVRVLVLTYNRTLKGYVGELARQQIAGTPDLQLEVRTFARFALDILQIPNIQNDESVAILKRLVKPIGLPEKFMLDEVQYLLGRFLPSDIEDYITTQRDGRGLSPRVDSALRRKILDEVVYPYAKEKQRRDLLDWNDLAVEAKDAPAIPWDVIIVDEAQDFSANQIRAVLAHTAAPDYSLTFVVDTAQRIYPRSYTWKEAGIVNPVVRLLKQNHRNTKQIAAFARGLVEGLTLGEDGIIPDFNAATAEGPLPKVLVGLFSEQMDWVVEHVICGAIEAGESVAFLHPLGWFIYVEKSLKRLQIPYVDLTRQEFWPEGDESVAISTIHSVKGLEFDHVVIIGLNQEVTPHGREAGDVTLENLRRLLAMGIGRARKTVTIGYKESGASSLIGYCSQSTYEEVLL
ncbi:3'-5' exonuclease [Nocardia asteroides]|uniref:3'-5' exonuclease n=1 Tax=Nocardia asteroides TaxID=1824 RepID=UPI001E385CFD|nr:3'-5' exonuclease [Nocardia asteroides]UGT62855.1 AAA family ATPase [Nocardia asteroides]